MRQMATSGVDAIRARLDKLGAEIFALDEKHVKLARFVQLINGEHRDAFDDHERECAALALAQVQQERDARARDLEAKITVFESRIVGIEDRIGARRVVIDECEDSLTQFPDVMQCVVAQHALLVRDLQDAQAEIGVE